MASELSSYGRLSVGDRYRLKLAVRGVEAGRQLDLRTIADSHYDGCVILTFRVVGSDRQHVVLRDDDPNDRLVLDQAEDYFEHTSHPGFASRSAARPKRRPPRRRGVDPGEPLPFDWEDIRDQLRVLAARAGVTLAGPVEVEYGFGWAPTVTWWHRNRRVHLYDAAGETDGRFVELAFVRPRRVHGQAVGTAREALEVIEAFLIDGRQLRRLPLAPWPPLESSHDGFIPQPPG
jgi:hypothetical protein